MSDGQPFSASDVAYTFELLKKYPQLNAGGLPLSGASAPSSTKVVVDFSLPAYTYLDSVLATKPVPKHIWSKVSDPGTYSDPNPVGEGPYLLSSFTPQVITFTKNPKYWQASKIAVQTMRYQAFDSASSIEAALESGQIDWEDHVFPNYKQLFARPSISGTNTSNGTAFILPNLATYPLDQLPVRQAISEAIDRSALTKAGGTGQQPADNPTGLTGPLARYIAPAYRSLEFGGADPAKAKSTLEQAGFKMGSNGIFITPKGTPLALTMLLGSGQENLISVSQVMRQELKQAGISLNIKTETFSAVTTDVRAGKFQLNINGDNGYFSPYNFYRGFDPEYYSPPGTLDQGDDSRYDNPSTTALFRTLAAAAPGSTAAKSATAAIEKVMVEQLPLIPLQTTSTQWAFRTNTFTGWPTKSNPYGFAEVLSDNVELVMLHLRAK